MNRPRTRSLTNRAGFLLFALLIVLGQGDVAGQRLEIEAPPELAAAQARLESFDTARLAGVRRLLGVTDPGPPIHVVLAPETSSWARQLPASIGGVARIAGFAVAGQNLVVLFPSRSPVYPDDTLEDVLHHEVAHVLMDRAAGGGPLPRWFHEGVAMAAERTWDVEDEARFLGELTLGARVGLTQVDDLFAGTGAERSRAYTLAGAFVRDLIRQYGAAVPGRILARVGAGAAFDAAFTEAIGHSVPDEEDAFWNRRSFWIRWLPFLTTSGALWLVVSLIALFAFARRRRKSAEIRRRWAAEGLDGPDA